MSEAPGPINFTMFLTMFGEKLNGTDPEDVIRNAFACFDEEASGQQPPGGGLDRAGSEHFTQGAHGDAGGAGLCWDLSPKARMEIPHLLVSMAKPCPVLVLFPQMLDHKSPQPPRHPTS